MIKNILIFFLFFCFHSSIKAQLQVFSLSDLDILIEELVTQELLGCNVDISNVQYIGNNNSLGRFTYNDICDVNFGIDRGMIMTSGLVTNALGPNNNTSSGFDYNIQYQNQFVVDYLLDHDVIVDGVDLFDASGVEFDLTTPNDIKLFFEMIYGSEEYMEWISPFYNDAFCFFVSETNGDVDPNFDSTPINIMETGYLLNSNSQCDIINKPISAWTIRPYSNNFNSPAINECLYIDNPDGDFCDAIGYDGYTKPMEFSLELMSEASYRIMIIISDASSGNNAGGLDSGVFIKKNIQNAFSNIDFMWSEPEFTQSNTSLGLSVSFTNTSSVNINENILYAWDFNNDSIIDSNEPNPIYVFEDEGSYIVSLTMQDVCTDATQSTSYELWVSGYDNTIINENINDISLFPNPADNYVAIKHSMEGAVLIQIFDLSGQIIYNKSSYNNNIMVSTSDFNPGIYSIVISDYNQSITCHKKMIVI